MRGRRDVKMRLTPLAALGQIHKLEEPVRRIEYSKPAAAICTTCTNTLKAAMVEILAIAGDSALDADYRKHVQYYIDGKDDNPSFKAWWASYSCKKRKGDKHQYKVSRFDDCNWTDVCKR